MPGRPAKPCGYPGCGRLVSDGTRRCEIHKGSEGRQERERRGKTSERGYGWEWQKARERHLAANPLCVYCEEAHIVRAATVVDHKKPHRGDMKLFWDPGNWQSLCTNCHSSRKQREENEALNRR